jgi:N-acetylglucosaminyl-diphospho-decaprenol L-rhamnosyltransferase
MDSAEEIRQLPLPISSPVLGVSIVNYFSHASVELLLESLSDFARDATVQVVIVDNSQDLERRECQRLNDIASRFANSRLRIEVLAAKSNLGYGAGNNLGVARLIETGSTFLWVLNPDTTVSGSAKALIAEASKSPQALWSTVTQENGVTSNGLGLLSTLTGQATASSRREVEVSRYSLHYPGGHSIIFSLDAWRQLNGFDEDYFLFMEEADLTLRSWQIGIAIGTVKSVTVHHDQGLTTGSSTDVRSKSLLAFTEATKSRMVFFRKRYPFRVPVIVLIRSCYIARVLTKGNTAGAKAIAKGIFIGLSKKLTSGV